MKSAGAELVKMNEVFNELEVLISAILSDIELEASSESASAQRDDTVALQRRASAQLLSSHAELEGKIEPEVLGRLKELIPRLIARVMSFAALSNLRCRASLGRV